MKRFLHTLSILSILWGLPSGTCLAEGSEADSVYTNHSMDELVITATRTRKLLKDSPILTRVVNRKDIELADATDLRDLLQQELPGVEFTYSMNQKLNMNVGGFAGQSVLILVDGERLAGETMENVDFSRIDMNNVERIEILRGAQSALYGAGAVGGVINIITRGAQEPWSLNLNARLADHRDHRYGGVLGLKQGRVGNMLDVQYTSVDNYTVCMDYADECDFRQVYGG
ncbi:MAG: TonB-dependent receptor, partial [Bacteroidaceae bacterium]|nr:TonB-dependent receptor [Bacteroidaceae bacterium]